MTPAQALVLEPGARVVLTRRRPAGLAIHGVAPMWVSATWKNSDRTHVLIKIRDRAIESPDGAFFWVYPHAIDLPPLGALWDAARHEWIDRQGAVVLKSIRRRAMMAFWLILGIIVFFDLWFWALEDKGDRLWPPTDEELRDRAAYRVDITSDRAA